MPLPHPPGYRPPLQRRLDRRRVLLAGLVFASLAALLLVLGRRAAVHAANALPDAAQGRALVVVLVAAGCGAWGELMRQLALLARSRGTEAED